jgi:hypothetical protein
LEASVKGEGAAIKTMSKSLHDSKAKIDILFNEMDNLTLELDAKSREFEEKLNELSGDVNMPA